jgi:hypothetical protein
MTWAPFAPQQLLSRRELTLSHKCRWTRSQVEPTMRECSSLPENFPKTRLLVFADG